VEGRIQWLSGQEAADVVRERLPREVRHRTGLGRRQPGRVADREHLGMLGVLEGALVDRDEAQFVAEARGAFDVLGAAVQRHDHRQVEGHLAFVVRHQPAALAVDLAERELGDQLDALGRQQPAQRLGGDRLGEGAVQRGDARQLDLVADTAPLEVPVGEEGELQWCDRALDGQVGHVHHDAPAL